MAITGGQATVADAREYACRYLANREHSRKELHEKLTRKGVPVSVINEAIESSRTNQDTPRNAHKFKVYKSRFYESLRSSKKHLKSIAIGREH